MNHHKVTKCNLKGGIMDARTSYMVYEIKELKSKVKSLDQELKLLVKVLLRNKELEKQYKELEEDKWKY